MYKILIVDNEKTIRTGLNVGIDWVKLNCTVTGLAEDGADALRQIEKDPPDIVLSDINMKQMSGLELCQILAERFPAIKCILITGFYEFDSAYYAIKSPNVVNLILKPTSVFKVSEAVEQAISHIKEEHDHQSLQREMLLQMKRNQELQQSIVLQDLIESTYPDPDAAEMLLSAGIRLEAYRVISLYLNCTEKQRGEPGLVLEAEATVCKYIRRIFTAAPCYLVYRHQQPIRIIVDVAELSGEKELLHDCCAELSDVTDSCTDFYISLGISRRYSKLQEMPRAASEADNAAKFAIYGGEYSIVSYDMVTPLSARDMEEVRWHMDKLLESITRLDVRQALEDLQDVNDYCQSKKMPFHAIVNIFVIITNVCHQQYYIYGKLAEVESTLSGQNSYYRQLWACNDPNTLYQQMARIIKTTITGVSRHYPSREDAILDVANYIQNNYAGDLSLEGIASVFYMSAGYLGRLFKNRFNVNITAYIQNVRINKAKELIRSTNLHTYEIAQAVGISDPVYFSKLFKKLTGCRVRDYRESLQSQSAEDITIPNSGGTS